MITGNRDEVRYAVEIYVLAQFLTHGRGKKQSGKKLGHFLVFVLRGDKFISAVSKRTQKTILKTVSKRQNTDI